MYFNITDFEIYLFKAETTSEGKIRVSSLNSRGELFRKGCVRFAIDIRHDRSFKGL